MERWREAEQLQLTASCPDRAAQNATPARSGTLTGPGSTRTDKGPATRARAELFPRSRKLARFPARATFPAYVRIADHGNRAGEAERGRADRRARPGAFQLAPRRLRDLSARPGGCVCRARDARRRRIPRQ